MNIVSQTDSKERSTILLVDDEPEINNMFKMMFELEGFNCSTSTSAIQVLKEINRINPDIILSDINMPGVDGFAFRAQVLSDESLKDIPFVFLTSKEDDQSTLMGYKQSIDGYIPKSTNQMVIVEKVKAILESQNKHKQKAACEVFKAAKEISSDLFPQTPPDLSGIKFSHFHIPYKGIPGGDFIDYVSITDDIHAVIVGDVMGKKWGAWFLTFAFISYLRSSIRSHILGSKSLDPAEILRAVNESVFIDTRLANYLTAVSLVIIDLKKNNITYSGAGDLPMLHVKKDTGVISYTSGGISLGIQQDGLYDTTSVDLNRGDLFLLYTDGVTETIDESGMQFGINGFKNCLTGFSVEDNITEVVKKVLEKYSGNNFIDDVTLLAIDIK